MMLFLISQKNAKCAPTSPFVDFQEATCFSERTAASHFTVFMQHILLFEVVLVWCHRKKSSVRKTSGYLAAFLWGRVKFVVWRETARARRYQRAVDTSVSPFLSLHVAYRNCTVTKSCLTPSAQNRLRLSVKPRECKGNILSHPIYPCVSCCKDNLKNCKVSPHIKKNIGYIFD